MMTVKQPKRLAFVLIAAIALSAFLTVKKPPKAGGGMGDIVQPENASEQGPDRIQRKAQRFGRAKEFQQPTGFINTEPFTLQQLVGDKVIVLDMWTYSCINCQRTLPYLEQWWQDYRDDGLVIVGNHAPEFAFEKKRENVEDAVERFNITYPVVMDNNYGTWNAYDNRYWPQKYVIGIDGFIRYEHIGEGAYEETRKKIEELLRERKQVLGLNITIERGPGNVSTEQPNSFLVGTPELYFGASRNDRLANGDSGVQTVQNLSIPSTIEKDKLYLSGRWAFTQEYASTDAANGTSSIVLRYQAKNVNMVMDSPGTATLQVRRDGQPLPPKPRGRDVTGDSTVPVDEERLYRIVEDTEYGTHTLNITVEQDTVDAYTFTFG